MQSSIVFSLLAGAVAASAASAASVSVYPPFDPETVDYATREAWCTSQLGACGLLCQDQKSGLQYVNNCSPDDVSYTCTCDDGKAPNATQYSQTIPFYICQQQVIGCKKDCGSSANLCVAACDENKQCGASDPKPPPKKTQPKGSKTTDTSDSSTVSYDGYGGSGTKATGTAGSTAAANTGTINLKGAGNSLAAFGELSVAVVVASFGLSIFALLQ